MNITIILGVGLAIGFLVVGFLIWKLAQKEPGNPFEEVLLEFKRDREDRYREQESLKNELREGSKSLREEFHRVNKTVDTKLSESSKQLNDRLDKSSTVIGSLQKELGKMGEIGTKIENLDKVLRAPKGRGAMGEESLEEILRSIFPQSLWERQYALGTGAIVDAVVKTTNGLIPIDAKFPLPAYEQIINAENDEQLLLAQKEFQKALKARIKEVTKYIRPEHGTLNFSVMFLPSESVYYEAAVRSRDIYEYAREKKVLLTGPNTMVYVLQTLFQAYQSQQFAAKAQEALQQLVGVKNQAEVLDEHLSVLGKHLGNANSKLVETQTQNQKLQGQIHRISNLEVESSVPEKPEPETLL